MNEAQTPTPRIETTPGFCGGKPRIAGHRIRVQDIVVWHERLGLTPDQIVSEHPSITMSDVHAALAYYYDHVEEINEDIRRSNAFAESIRTESPSKLLERLSRTHASPLPPG